MQGLGTLGLGRRERREDWVALQLLSCSPEPKTLGPSPPPALVDGQIFKTGLYAGTGAPWAGQDRAKEEKARLARLAMVSEGNFGVDPPTGSRQWLMIYWPVSRDRSTLSWT